ncbi:bifunctional phosphopantothenoylcysteine decarboxylase/phosphopantothenate--cysteine ligase CoaBC [Lichenibacterium minor]|uniref:Coenzyme A biosynthesis bifunctional protein CoaBC n=1 Tax=Lichenibacterium minor TaxID=2316528 RepID=A0A4Q2U461_9HYPH|nr:bifunctional phosphopantothenoylcysteine decarboxylase/phosphopantothenate--cysteine ligase CoaBC [Lichenibacterium minor]RYC29751.1 bifunctional phosphopantothenoylcysteine decarboxylase/phosphopantothenate--cysteine ligase CoaBC [Lichenibacterium minor]
MAEGGAASAASEPSPGDALRGRRVLLIVGGGIAAYKALDLIRRLRERGAAVRAVMTASAAQFVTPLAVASLTGERVHDDLFSLTDEAEMGHIQLSRSADLVLVAPATANLMAKAANGLADDLASTLLLATDKRVLMAPSMNVRMWLHPATRRNLERLRADGVLVVGPGEGAMACGEFGPGRMAEPLDIVAAAARALAGDTAVPLPAPPPGALRGRRVVVTSGPTHESIDPVRYIANRSSGRQGHAIAAAAAAAGAEVVLVSGPVSIADPAGVAVVRVETAREMLSAVEAALPADLFVAAAAVADWRPTVAADLKIKKRDGAPDPVLALDRNPDILAAVAARREGRPRLVVGFAAETDRLLDHAADKLRRKGADVIVANDVGSGSGVMGGADNEVHLVSRGAAGAGGDARIEAWPKLGKDEVARRLVARFAALLDARP